MRRLETDTRNSTEQRGKEPGSEGLGGVSFTPSLSAGKKEGGENNLLGDI